MTRTGARREATRLQQKFPAYAVAYTYVKMSGGHLIHGVRVTDPATQRSALIVGLANFVRATQGQFAWDNEQPVRHAASTGDHATTIAHLLRGKA